MTSNRIAVRCAGFAIVACAMITPIALPAASDSSHESSKAKPIAKNKADASTPRRGLASYYSKHLTGRKTASGEAYDPQAMTAAHRSLPMGTRVKVVNPRNDKSVVVTVNDRGPVPKNRVIDLSGAAAKELGMTRAGVTRVETEVIGKSGLPAKPDTKDASN